MTLLQGGANFSRFNIDQAVTISEQVDEVEIVIDPKDIELSTARSGGAGGKYTTLSNLLGSGANGIILRYVDKNESIWDTTSSKESWLMEEGFAPKERQQ